MARILSERQEFQRNFERDLSASKNNEMIQQGGHGLTLREQKCILYAISKIKPDDTEFREYVFDIKDFYAVCGLTDDNYTELKGILKGIADKSWWHRDASGSESLLRWLSVVRLNQRKHTVTIEFHKDMVPFLLQLASSDVFYTSYELKYILPMSSQYGPRLYELLKSYSNYPSWFFPTPELKKLLGAENYKNFNDFKRFVLDPAVADINTYTDLSVFCQPQKEGVRYTRVNFRISRRKEGSPALANAIAAGLEKLDGTLQEQVELAQKAKEKNERRRQARKNKAAEIASEQLEEQLEGQVDLLADWEDN